MDVDVVYRNARILTMDPDRPRAGAFAVLGDRIVAVGGPETAGLSARRTVDLAGRCVLPGFHDAHNHMAWYGLSLDELDLSPGRVARVEDVYDLVAREAARRPPGEWIIGAGYDQNRMAGGHPTAAGLDRAAPHHPVWLKHTSGHMCAVNSAVLTRCGADTAPDPDGGRIVRDAAGAPTGLLQERAQELVRNLLVPFPAGVLARALGAAARRYAAEGITSVQEAGIGGGWIGHSGVEIAAYQQARDEDALLQRVTLMPASDVLHPLPGHADDPYRSGLDLGIRTGFGDDRLRLGAVKVFSDGSLIGRTSAMCCDFADDPGNRGYLQAGEEELAATIIAAHRAGWQVATHAIGDRAVDVVLSAYEEAQRRYPRHDPRHRIEHCAVTSPEQVERVVRLGVIPVPQGSLVREAGDGMAEALGPERADWCYRVRSFTDRGVEVPGSSDRPVAGGAPLAGIHALVTRRTAGGRVLAPGERVDVATALRSYTVGSAHAAHAERTRGRIAPGFLADFAVLDADPAGVDPDALPEIGVLATVVGGRAVHDLGVLT
ncbi:amidohydrolase [Streptomyces sp. F63]|uniref:amidohydrolase n=1 Tax=Streptomyces sp. F63 TaxID=2824887 RepID=UPI001B35B7B0|nr:amidohydrolase [Streptomyces sp. F63]MBQ0987271.1 amidohydrolase [Streptomyces sp. F63]